MGLKTQWKGTVDQWTVILAVYSHLLSLDKLQPILIGLHKLNNVSCTERDLG